MAKGTSRIQAVSNINPRGLFYYSEKTRKKKNHQRIISSGLFLAMDLRQTGKIPIKLIKPVVYSLGL